MNRAQQQLHEKYRINYFKKKKNHLIFKKLMMRQKPTERALRANYCLLCIKKPNLTKISTEGWGGRGAAAPFARPQPRSTTRVPVAQLQPSATPRAPRHRPGARDQPREMPTAGQSLRLPPDLKCWEKRGAGRKARPRHNQCHQPPPQVKEPEGASSPRASDTECSFPER